jgi:hypothetical protein
VPMPLPTTGIGPTGIAVTLVPLGALLVLDTTVTLAVFKPWGQTRFQRHGPRPSLASSPSDASDSWCTSAT